MCAIVRESSSFKASFTYSKDVQRIGGLLRSKKWASLFIGQTVPWSCWVVDQSSVINGALYFFIWPNSFRFYSVKFSQIWFGLDTWFNLVRKRGSLPIFINFFNASSSLTESTWDACCQLCRFTRPALYDGRSKEGVFRFYRRQTALLAYIFICRWPMCKDWFWKSLTWKVGLSSCRTDTAAWSTAYWSGNGLHVPAIIADISHAQVQPRSMHTPWLWTLLSCFLFV